MHQPRLVGGKQEPEGTLDYRLVARGFEDAELRDRDEHFVVLITHWSGDPGASYLVQVWLLGEGTEPTTQLSSLTPVNVLLATPTLNGEDAWVLRRLLRAGADAGFALLGPRYDVTAPVLFTDGRSPLEYVTAGDLPHGTHVRGCWSDGRALPEQLIAAI